MQMPAVCFPKTLDNATLSHPHFRNCEAATSAAAAAVTQMSMSQDDLKRIAAHRAVDLVESGMVLGLGTGSTAIHALQRIADLLRSGELTGIVGIPTSKKTEGEARALGIPLADLESNPNIDLSIDGADEVDPFLNLVKGRGGSLLREKMIEGASKRFVVIVDESKWVERLGGSKMAVPVEVIPFGWNYTLTRLKKIFDGKAGFDARLRMKGEEIFVTDNLNYIIDLFFENGIEGDLDGISDEILRIVGVVEHGMFLGLATEVIIAGNQGVVVKTRGEVDAAAEQRRHGERVVKVPLLGGEIVTMPLGHGLIPINTCEVLSNHEWQIRYQESASREALLRQFIISSTVLRDNVSYQSLGRHTTAGREEWPGQSS